MQKIALFIVLISLLAVSVSAVEEPAKAKTPDMNKPKSHTTRKIEGWNVRIDDRLLQGDGAVRGELALKLLTARLVAITVIMPEKQLAQLRNVTIQIDLAHGGLRNMQYHPGAQWLKKMGYSEDLVKCVHIPDIEDLLSPFENHRQPSAVLHELAHAYHDQVLGFEEPRVLAAWKKFVESGRGKSVLTSPGGEREHYALTDQKEFFAEMTESYLAVNDFYPFVAGELKKSEPEIFALMSEIWGPLPGRSSKPAAPAKAK